MEEDRAQTDLGIAADIEETQRQAAEPSPPTPSETKPSEPVVKQPKKRFVGRRAATEAAASKPNGASSDSTAVGRRSIHPH